MPTSSPVIVALDFPEAADALELARRLSPRDCRLKVGKELFTAAGPALVDELQHMGFELFLDLKFHDIPNTVAAALGSAASLGVWMVNVHASGGRRMLEASATAFQRLTQPPVLIGVTVLTSMGDEEFAELGCQRSVAEQVQHLAVLCRDCGLSGVVCSAQESRALRELCGPGFQLVTPGIRPAGTRADDQQRIVTPVDAMQNGSDYLVIGRPITRADDPAAALRAINEGLGTVG